MPRNAPKNAPKKKGFEISPVRVTLLDFWEDWESWEDYNVAD